MSDYLIWSNEHRAWWGPNRCGYTSVIERAGRYARAEAMDIAACARGGWARGKNPPEIAIAEADAVEQATDRRRAELYANSPPCKGDVRRGTGCGNCARCRAWEDALQGEDCA